MIDMLKALFKQILSLSSASSRIKPYIVQKRPLLLTEDEKIIDLFLDKVEYKGSAFKINLGCTPINRKPRYWFRGKLYESFNSPILHLSVNNNLHLIVETDLKNTTVKFELIEGKSRYFVTKRLLTKYLPLEHFLVEKAFNIEDKLNKNRDEVRNVSVEEIKRLLNG